MMNKSTNLDKALSNDTMKELFFLEHETEALLQSVRKSQPSNGQISSNSRGQGKRISQTKGKLGSSTGRKTKKQKEMAGTVSLDYTSKFQSTLEKTRNLFSSEGKTSRITVEVLDDASPDCTPRQDYDDLKKPTKRKSIDNSKILMDDEQENGHLSFQKEKQRAIAKEDIFVPAPGVSITDVDVERQRLAHIEEISRIKQENINKNISSRRQYLAQDRAAIHIQSLLRGHLGRKKFILTKRLKEMMDNDSNDWVEVRDKDSGDIWFYNTKSGISQWERPVEMRGTLATREKLKKLPTLQKTNNRYKNRAVTADSSSLTLLPSLDNKSGYNNSMNNSYSQSSGMMLSQSVNSPLKFDINGKKSIMSSSTGNLKQILQFQSSTTTTNNEYEYQNKEELQREIRTELGVNEWMPPEGLSAPDGSFKPQLRSTIMNALSDQRFSSLSSVIADDRWANNNTNNETNNLYDLSNNNSHSQLLSTASYSSSLSRAGTADRIIDKTRRPMVAVLTFNKKKSKRNARINVSDDDQQYHHNSNSSHSRSIASAPSEYISADITNLTIRDVSHPGFEGGSSFQQSSTSTMCFGCWSSGISSTGCSLHPSDERMKPSRTMLLCRNWDIAVLRKRYRSEEIQEIFMKKAASLKYDTQRKRFLTVSEQRHPIYRLVGNVLTRFNFRSNLIIRIKRWLHTFTEVIRSGEYKPLRTSQKAKLIRLRRSLYFHGGILRYSDTIRQLMPVAPITGYSWPERIETEKYLFNHFDSVLSREIEIILAYPTPHPIELYLPRQYELSVPIAIPMPRPDYVQEANIDKVLPSNTYISESHSASWLESLSASIVRDSVHQAISQIKAISPLPETELLYNAKYSLPTTIKFATLGRKPTAGMIAQGGLPVELLVSQLISTYVPAQYGNIMVMDKSAVTPGMSAEITITFSSLPMLPIVQPYKSRPVDHPMNFRRSPTIGLNSLIEPYNKFHYGTNRPDQTGESISHGFRTSVWTLRLKCFIDTKSHVFTPGAEVAALNATANHLSVTTHADNSYPFCDPSTRDNTTLDFYHLLLTGTTTMPKAQVFTSLTVQEPGDFQKGTDTNLPMGHLVVSIYRSWAFTQKDVIEEFVTDDGIKYWYDRKTGHTYWERPLHADEEASPLRGGTVLDMDHPEEPMTVRQGTEGRGRRYLQGDFRKKMLRHHEDTQEASNRRRNANNSAVRARATGKLPNPDPLDTHNYTDNDDNDNYDEDQMLTAEERANKGRKVSINSIATHISEEGGIVNDHGSRRSLRTPLRQVEVMGTLEEFGSEHHVRAQEQSILGPRSLTTSATSAGGVSMINIPDMDNSYYNNYTDDGSMSMGSPMNRQQLMASSQGAPTATAPMLDMTVLSNLSATIGEMFSTGRMQNATPQDMIQLGLGMGMAIMQSQSQGQGQSQGQSQQFAVRPMFSQSAGAFGNVDQGNSPLYNPDGGNNNHNRDSNVSSFVGSITGGGGGRNTSSSAESSYVDIGAVYPSNSYTERAMLDHTEEQSHHNNMQALLAQPLTAVEIASEKKVIPTETPDIALTKVEFEDIPPMNADEAVKEEYPVQVYPELFSRSITEQKQLTDYFSHQSAGVGTSFVLQKDAINQEMVPGSRILRRTVVPLPVGFFEAIKSKHVAKQEVDYLPQVPNLPQTRTVGRVKPRSTAVDWLAISFDPWSAGKNPLDVEFIPSLQSKMEKMYGMAKAKDEMDAMRLGADDGVLDIQDKDGQAVLQVEATKTQQIVDDFKKLTSLARNGKFMEVEELMNQHDWNVPIDYQDEAGNALIHIAAQNGNRRMVKLCLRRGGDINIQNVNGHTPLHFAYSYGYEKLGQYIIHKGGDDSIRNKDGLTCYEGLSGQDLSLL